MPPKMDRINQKAIHAYALEKKTTLRRGKAGKKIEARQRIYFWNAKEPLAYCPK